MSELPIVDLPISQAKINTLLRGSESEPSIPTTSQKFKYTTNSAYYFKWQTLRGVIFKIINGKMRVNICLSNYIARSVGMKYLIEILNSGSIVAILQHYGILRLYLWNLEKGSSFSEFLLRHFTLALLWYSVTHRDAYQDSSEDIKHFIQATKWKVNIFFHYFYTRVLSESMTVRGFNKL